MNICLITDRRQLSPEARTTRDEVLALVRWLEEAVSAGVDLIQLREPDLSGRALTSLAQSVKALAAGSRTRVLVNDRSDVAIASGCDGVHLRGDGPPVDAVRKLAPDIDWLIGRSIHTIDEVSAHAAADYLLFGTVFDSGPKRGAGLDVLGAAAAQGRRVSVPVVAIGGVTVERARACLEAGASGVAGIRLFLSSVTTTCRQLREVFDAAGTRHLQ